MLANGYKLEQLSYAAVNITVPMLAKPFIV